MRQFQISLPITQVIEVINSETGEVRPVSMSINKVFPLTLQGNSLHFIKQGEVGKLFTTLSDEQVAALEA